MKLCRRLFLIILLMGFLFPFVQSFLFPNRLRAAPPETLPGKTQTVYVTSLKKNGRPIDLTIARQQKKPCKVCKPPSLKYSPVRICGRG